MYKFEDYKFLYDLSQSYGFSESLNQNLDAFVSKLKERFDINQAGILLVNNDHTQLYLTTDSQFTTLKDPYYILDQSHPIYLISETEGQCFVSYKIHAELCFLVSLGNDSDYEYLYYSIKDVLEKFGLYFMRSRVTDSQLFNHEIIRFLNNAQMGYLVTENYKCSAVNDFYLELLGYSREEYLGRSPFDFIHPDDQEVLIRDLDIAEKNNDTSTKSRSFRVIAKNGDIMHVCSHMSPIFEKGKMVKVISLINDITELVVSRQQMIIKESKLNSILADSPNGIMFFTAEGYLDFSNIEALKHFKNHFNIQLERGMTFEQLYPESIKDSRLELFELALKGQRNNFEINHLSQVDEREYSYIIHYLPVKDQLDKILGVLTVSQDITEVKEKEKKIIEREAILNAIFEATVDGIYALDKSYNVIAINNQSKHVFSSEMGIDIELGDNLVKQVDAKLFNRWKNNTYSRVFAGEQFTARVISPKNKNLYFENTYTPLKDENGKIFGCLEVSKNISAAVLGQQKLIDSEERYRSLIETIPIGLFRLAIDGSITFASRRVSQIIGFGKEEVLKMRFQDFISGGDKERFLVNVKSIMTSKTPHFDKFKIRHKDGHYVYIEGFATVLEGEDSKIDCFQIGFYDITDRVNTQYELRSVRERYEILFKNMFEGVLVYDFKNEKILDFNNSAVDLLKADKHTLKGQSRYDYAIQHSDYYPEIDLFEKLEEHKTAVLTGESISLTGVLLNGNKEEFISKISIINADQSEGIAYVIFTDITKEVKNSEQLKEKTLLYENLIQSSFDGIDIIKYKEEDGFIFDGEMIVRNANMHRFFQQKDLLFDQVDELLSLSPEIQPSGVTSKELVTSIIGTLIKEGEYKTDYRFNNQEKVLDIETYARMIKINDFVYMVRNFRDITSQKMQKDIIERQIQVLNTKNSELQKYIDSNLQLENFAYIASHDLKAPIRSVISFMQLLKRNLTGKIDDKNFRFLEIVLEASSNMQVLIDDLLTYSRINTQAIEFEEFNLNKLLDRLMIELNSSIEEKSGRVILKDIPEFIIADKSRIRQVFQNLITNALKFTPEGVNPLIVVSCKVNASEYVFKLKDNGIGIEQDYLDKIFLMFKKLHSENKYQGTGIGLSICKKVVEQHLGNIWVESEIGKGSTFYFTVNRSLEIS